MYTVITLYVLRLQVPDLVVERDRLKKQVENMDRDAELEKDRVSKLVENMKTDKAEVQQSMQEKV